MSHLGIGTENRKTIIPFKSEVCESYKRIDNLLDDTRIALISIHKKWRDGIVEEEETREQFYDLCKRTIKLLESERGA